VNKRKQKGKKNLCKDHRFAIALFALTYMLGLCYQEINRKQQNFAVKTLKTLFMFIQ